MQVKMSNYSKFSQNFDDNFVCQVTSIQNLMTSHNVDFLLKRTHRSGEVQNMKNKKKKQKKKKQKNKKKTKKKKNQHFSKSN